MKRFLKCSALLGVASTLLGGCAVYGPPPPYTPSPYYYQPQAVYVQPAPVMVAPPVSFGLNIGGYWGGHGGGRWHR